MVTIAEYDNVLLPYVEAAMNLTQHNNEDYIFVYAQKSNCSFYFADVHFIRTNAETLFTRQVYIEKESKNGLMIYQGKYTTCQLLQTFRSVSRTGSSSDYIGATCLYYFWSHLQKFLNLFIHDHSIHKFPTCNIFRHYATNFTCQRDLPCLDCGVPLDIEIRPNMNRKSFLLLSLWNTTDFETSYIQWFPEEVLQDIFMFTTFL